MTLVEVKQKAQRGLHHPGVVLTFGLAVSALAGAPAPLQQLSLIGVWLATCANGLPGAAFAAITGVVSYLAFGRPTELGVVAALSIAAAATWAMPRLVVPKAAAVMEDEEDSGASAIMIDCDGFASLDATYGEGAGDHVRSMLYRAIRMETRERDLVAPMDGNEIVLVLENATPNTAERVMSRVEARFSQWLADAGYECNLSVGLASVDHSESGLDDLLREARSMGHPYMD